MSSISEHDLQEAHDKLRDQFAMAAFSGLISQGGTWNGSRYKTKAKYYAAKAYHYADAMLEARKL